MSPFQDESPAFRLALLKSERLRIVILLVAMGVALLARLIRTLAAWNPENASALLYLVLFTGVLAVVEVLVLRAIQFAIASGESLSHPVWLLNILLETCFPAFLIAFLSSTVLPPEYRPVVNPGILLYFLLISLSTLRLKPWISILCGFSSVFTYLLAASHHGWSPRWIRVNASLFAPQKIVTAYAISILIAAIAAALVAREFRGQVEAALREAETRRQVEHLQHDMNIARSIQQSLLPKVMPEVSGFQIAAWNKPADQTGGDYYDWQPLPNGKFVTALADVTGHGIGPALLASVCRAYARTNFRNQDSFPKAMEEINSAVAADVREGRFITFVAAIFGPESSTVELLSAGHAPLFLYTLKSDRFDLMEANGLPLGISDAFASDPPYCLQLASGDLLLLATDGFFEWANAGQERFGTERLAQTIRAAREKSAAGIISDLHQEVLRFAAGTKQMDDLTAIVLKRD